MQFKKNNSFNDRKAEAIRIKNIYKDRIPVIVERSNSNANVPIIDKMKYLVPEDLTIGQFMYVIRKRINLDAHKSIFIFVNDSMPPTCELISNLYDRCQDKDGFLYITYAGENTFGFNFI